MAQAGTAVYVRYQTDTSPPDPYHQLMPVRKRTILERWLEIAAHFGGIGSSARVVDEEPPLRSELYSADQMEQHGKKLALEHKLAPGRARDRLLMRLADNHALLVEVCGDL